MDHPPFRTAALSAAASLLSGAVSTAAPLAVPDLCCAPSNEGGTEAGLDAGPARLRLAEMDMHLHCSIIGTCLSTADLRRVMARFVAVAGLSELDLHHEAVRLASENREAARALHKALDRRHEASVQRLARIREPQRLAECWQQALDSGEVPGAYWALLSHRHATPELRQRVFGDVHMLSHLVGAANRADIRRLVALERENAELRDRAERQQERLGTASAERDRERLARSALERRCRLLHLRLTAAERRQARSARPGATASAGAHELALQTQRREAAEAHAHQLSAEFERLQQEHARLAAHAEVLARELAAAETELHDRSRDACGRVSALAAVLRGRRLLYVGGRPSSSAAIRDLVCRHGGEFQRHDGGLEERKGLLASALAWATLVVFPVDCIDHDSAQMLKRSCVRQSVPFLPLRSAGVASFAAALQAWAQPRGAQDRNGPCLRHG